MSRAPNAEKAYHHGDLHHALLSAALQLVETHGVESLSLREAARQVGVSPAAMYRHFADKTALLAELAANGFTLLADAMLASQAEIAREEHDGPAAATQRFRAVGRAYIHFALGHQAHFRVMFGPWRSHTTNSIGPIRGRATDQDIDPYQALCNAIEGLNKFGLLPVPRRPGAELQAWSAVHGLASLLIEGPVRFPNTMVRDTAIEDLLTFVLNGLTHP